MSIASGNARAWVGHRLERGAWSGPLARSLANVYARCASPVRPLVLPPRTQVIGVGGATLGGAGKTPFVRELARQLAMRHHPVAVVATSYLARPAQAFQVAVSDSAQAVGDEALMLAQALRPYDVPVVVAPRRQAAVDRAARLAPCVIVDGLLQSTPDRLSLSLLILDGASPWGSGRCPPAGDLRASRQALLKAMDRVLLRRDPEARPPVLATPPSSDPVLTLDAPGFCPVLAWDCALAGFRTPSGSDADFSQLSGLRVGLLTTIARADRVALQLRSKGIVVAAHRRYGDHCTPRPRCCKVSPGIDAWLTTEKCATKIGPSFEGAPVCPLRLRVQLPRLLLDECAQNAH
jgi:tetraacyldisaccharide 4'-kinase